MKEWVFNDTILLDHKPIFSERVASNKAEVNAAFSHNMVDNLQTFTNVTFFGRELEFHQQMPIPSVGTPDHCVMKNNIILFFVEIKTKWNINCEDIVGTYNNDDLQEEPSFIPIVQAVQQVFGYLGEGKLRYGVLSTYEKMWFLYRPSDNLGCL